LKCLLTDKSSRFKQIGMCSRKIVRKPYKPYNLTIFRQV
jgi:hypothetical protein